MKKTIIIATIIAALAIMIAVVLGFALGGDTSVKGTTGTSGTIADTTGAPTPKCEHTYEGGVCTLCGAEEPTAAEYFSFRLLDDGTYSIGAKLITELPERLIIPDTYEGKPVTTIRKKGFIGSKNIKYVYIHEGITTIEEEAFLECRNAAEIIFPASLEIVDDRAFENCDSVTEIAFKGECVVLCERSFAGCDLLEKAVFECSVQGEKGTLSAIFSDCKSLEIVDFKKGLLGKDDSDNSAVLYGTFQNCESLKSFTLPEGLGCISAYAFAGCTALESLVIPETITRINMYAFLGCDKLLLSAKGENANLDITARRVVDKLSKTLIWQGDAAPIPTDGSVICIGQGAFEQNREIAEIIIPPCVEAVEDSAFAKCENLKSVTWQSTQKHVPQMVFYNCIGLESVIFEEEITQISSSAFNGCSALKSFAIPEGVLELSSGAFKNCDSLETLRIPKSVTVIRHNALVDCKYLSKIYYSGTTEEWNAIEKYNLRGAVTVYCTDGEVYL